LKRKCIDIKTLKIKNEIEEGFKANVRKYSYLQKIWIEIEEVRVYLIGRNENALCNEIDEMKEEILSTF